MAKKVTLVAGIDLSTSGCLVGIHDAESGRSVRTGRAVRNSAGNAADWWETVSAAIRDAGGFQDVSALALTAFTGLVCLDADGTVIHVDVASHTPVAAAAALRDDAPALAADVDAVLQPQDLLTWWLRGFGAGSTHGPRLEELTTDRSAASVAGWWNADTGRYEHGRLNEALGHAAIKPRVMRPDAWGGEAAKNEDLGIRTGRIIGAGARRHAAAILGAQVRGGANGHRAFLVDDARAVGTPADRPCDAERVRSVADATGAFLWEVALPAPAAAAGDTAADEVDAAVALLHGAGADIAEVTDLTGAVMRAAAVDGMAAQAAWASTRTLPDWSSTLPDVVTGS